MRSSTVPARIITALIGVVVTPIALGLLSTGGWGWYAAVGSFDGFDLSAVAGPTALQAIAIALLVGLVLTGLWSAAGLLTAGILSIVPIAFSLFPSLLMSIYQLRLPLPREWIDGLAYGVPLAILPALGGMGLALWSARHRPARSGTLHAIGFVASPLLLLGGGWMLALSAARAFQALQRFQLGVSVDAAAYAIGGAVLIVAGLFFTKWSPFALLLPALALIVITPLMIMRASAFFGFVFALDRDTATGLTVLVTMGAAVAAAMLYIVFTIVMVRTRSRATVQHPAMVFHGADPSAPAYPMAASSDASYPGAAGSPTGSGYPQIPGDAASPGSDPHRP